MFALNNFLLLIKYKISLAVVFTTLAAFVVCKGALGLEISGLLLGVFFLSSGALAFNQWQESSYDALMNRTEKRPIPHGLIKKNEAFIIILMLIFAGLMILFFFTPRTTFALGIFNILWYNAFYTPLKRHSVFAVIPGSLIGAVPALMGWTAAGCHIADLRIISFAVFLVLWQIPHFWLILYYYNEDYIKGGFPNLKNTFSFHNMRYVVLAWLLASCSSTLLFPVFGLIIFPVFIILLVVSNFIFIVFVFYVVLPKEKIMNKMPLVAVNIFMLWVVILVLVQSLLAG